MTAGFVGAERRVEGLTSSGVMVLGHDDLQWSVVGVAVVGGWYSSRAVLDGDARRRADRAGVGAWVPGRDAAAAPYATASTQPARRASSPATSASR